MSLKLREVWTNQETQREREIQRWKEVKTLKMWVLPEVRVKRQDEAQEILVFTNQRERGVGKEY